jgi:hypothetical protein
VAAYYLGKDEEALRAWEEAASGGNRRAGELAKELKKSRTPLAGWRAFWFGRRDGRGWALLGGGLVAVVVLLALALLPFALQSSAGDRFERLQLGGDWKAFALPLLACLVVLLLPVLRHIPLRSVSASFGPLKIEAATASPEPAHTPLNIEDQLKRMRQTLGRAQPAAAVGWSSTVLVDGA